MRELQVMRNAFDEAVQTGFMEPEKTRQSILRVEREKVDASA